MIDDGSNQPDVWLRERIARAAATLNGLPPELRKAMAHRTNSRRRPNQSDAPREAGGES